MVCSEELSLLSLAGLEMSNTVARETQDGWDGRMFSAFAIVSHNRQWIDA